MDQTRTQTRTMRTGFVVAMTGLVATVILTACSSGNGSGSGRPTAASNDAFIAQVIPVVANTADNREPELIDSIVATSPETTEPVTVVF